MSTSYASVSCRVDGPVARIQMNRPEKRHALDHRLMDDLDAVLHQCCIGVGPP